MHPVEERQAPQVVQEVADLRPLRAAQVHQRGAAEHQGLGRDVPPIPARWPIGGDRFARRLDGSGEHVGPVLGQQADRMRPRLGHCQVGVNWDERIAPALSCGS